MRRFGALIACLAPLLTQTPAAAEDGQFRQFAVDIVVAARYCNIPIAATHLMPIVRLASDELGADVGDIDNTVGGATIGALAKREYYHIRNAMALKEWCAVARSRFANLAKP